MSNILIYMYDGMGNTTYHIPHTKYHLSLTESAPHTGNSGEWLRGCVVTNII